MRHDVCDLGRELVQKLLWNKCQKDKILPCPKKRAKKRKKDVTMVSINVTFEKSLKKLRQF